MNLRQAWYAVGDRFEFQRWTEGFLARITRTGTAWSFTVQSQQGIVARGTAMSWDDAVARVESVTCRAGAMAGMTVVPPNASAAPVTITG